MEKYQTITECIGYVSAPEETNTDERTLIAGSKNVLVDRERKTKTRAGYTRLGAGNAALTPIRSAATWNTSSGAEFPLRVYDDELEVYLGTVDGVAVNAWTRVKDGWSTTATLRFTTWFDATEDIDLLLFVQGDANIYEWGGGVAVIDSLTGTTVTKGGTDTFAQNRFYTTRDKVVICVRTGTEYTYSGGESTITLTGIADTTGLIVGDILVQKIVTASNKPAASHTNDTIFTFENQVCIGSDANEEGYLSSNDDYDDFSFSSPRISGEGGLLTLTDPIKGFGVLGSTLVIFAGRSSIFQAEYTQITVGSTLAETLKVKKLQTGIDQSAINQELIIPIGNEIAFVSHEPALRVISNPNDLIGVNPETYSNPIRPDFDAEGVDGFSGATGIWYKNAIYIQSRVDSLQFVLEFVEDADGKKRRFWQAPQTLPMGSLSIIDGSLHGHSNAVPETYELYSGTSDAEYEDIEAEDKQAFEAVMAFAYRTGKDRANLKNMDEYFSEGQILENTDITLKLLYDFGGATDTVQKTIEGDDGDLTYEDITLASLGQASLGTNPLGASSVEPENTLKYRVIFELPKEDFHEIQEIYTTNTPDAYFSVISRGMNMKLSTRKDNIIRR